MIKAVNLSKAYGEQVLFTDANFLINQGERVGLVGRNGHGKTTLLRLLTGEEEPDSGTITFPKNYTIGYLQQHLKFTRPTLLEEACFGLRAAQQGESWQVEKILLGLGFTKDDFQRPPAEFSGGFQVRLNLAKVLAAEPNLLLLDEPSNYLDITSIRWLVRFLQTWKNELILVTHDRHLLDQVITHTLGIHRQKLRKLAGGTAKFYAQLAKEEEIYEKTRLNEEKKRKEVELFINRFRYKATLSSRVQSRIKMLEKQERLEKLAKPEELEFSFPEAPMPGKLIMEAKNLSFSYPDGPLLIDDLSFTVGKNDRIGIIGKNGKGKSTLLRLLAGELLPRKGIITRHPALQTAYFGQTNVERLNPEQTILEELMGTSPDCPLERVRKISGAFMFSGDLALKKIRVLSGGEKSRVLLSKLLLTPSNLLLLDEPTNHLDMEACDSLMETLDAYNGALILVTHNEMYLHALVNKLIVFDRNGVSVFNGNYQRFLEEIGWEADQEGETGKREVMVSGITTNDRKALRQERAEIITRRSLVLKPLEIKINQLETAISQLEEDLLRNNEALITASATGDGEAIAKLAKGNAEINEEVEKLYMELAEVTDDYETAAAAFAAELEKLNAG